MYFWHGNTRPFVMRAAMYNIQAKMPHHALQAIHSKLLLPRKTLTSVLLIWPSNFRDSHHILRSINVSRHMSCPTRLYTLCIKCQE
ncbi:hypothetical protein GDO81_010871 [Engystomops pustulosus]|uniref:Uncharacterized protein n=1 Tax=Engystomops pustulosus TaxID=76066 RepID=A0AAV7C386_ENGPU|nr:hypothetical protein GDO81_010871 [Engystomops pustulosus]